MGDLAILIPNYNGASFIVDTVNRYASGFPGCRIVVVDDASTDDSLGRLSATAAKVIARSANGGFAAAVNTGLRVLKTTGCTHVLVSNSDIVVDDRTCREIEAAILACDDQPAVAVLGFVEEGATRVAEGCDISGFLFTLRMSVVDSIGYFDESFFMYGEEQDYFRRVVEGGCAIRQTGIRVRHVAEGSGSSRLRNSWLAIRNSIYLEVKRFAWWRAFRTAGVLFLTINHLYRPSGGEDPSFRRVRRPGIFLANVFLIAALCWSAFKTLKGILGYGKPQSSNKDG